MRAEFFDDVLDVIIGRRATDEKFFGDFTGRFAFCQTLQDFKLAFCQIRRGGRRFFVRENFADVDARQTRFRNDEIAHQKLEPFLHIGRANDVQRVGIGRGRFVDDDDRNIAPLAFAAGLHLYVVAFERLTTHRALANRAVFAADASAFVNAVQNFIA